MTVEEVISAFDSGKLLGDDELVEFCYLAKDYCVQREIVRNRYLEGQTVFEIGNRYFRVSCRYDTCSEYSIHEVEPYGQTIICYRNKY